MRSWFIKCCQQQTIEGLRSIGDRVLFEYHCSETHDSAHAQWWYRSHQPVIIINIPPSDGLSIFSWNERAESASPIIYTIRWDDGFEGDVFEDELLDSEAEYQRPDPPKGQRQP